VIHEVAIYAASAGIAGFYDQSEGRDGGAERQMYLLARALAERGGRVAHVIFPPREPVALSYPLTLVHRDPRYRGGWLPGSALEALAVWRALRTADAAVVVIRSASPMLGVAALFCVLHRRRLIFSSSNVSDFTLESMPSRWKRALYRMGVRRADTVVVQSEDQRVLALEALPTLRRVVRIASFAEKPDLPPPSDRPKPDAFLWFGRWVGEKQPMKYVELARRLPEARFRMILTPDTRPAHFLEDVEAAARGIENLDLLDPISHAELMELIARSVAVVNTSTLEGMPNSFLEAWAHGVPVLTLEFDPDRIVAESQLGVTAEGSWDRFVAGAQQLWDSRFDRADLSTRTRSYIEAEHSLEAVSAQWERLIEELRRDG